MNNLVICAPKPMHPLPSIYTKFGSYVASHIYTFISIKVVIRLEGMHITSQRQRSSHLHLLSDKNQKPPVASTIMHVQVSYTVGYHRANVSRRTVSEKKKKKNLSNQNISALINNFTDKSWPIELQSTKGFACF